MQKKDFQGRFGVWEIFVNLHFQRKFANKNDIIFTAKYTA
jgi:hypothetical protein